jgi:Flp pilus assembly protein TadG
MSVRGKLRQEDGAAAVEFALIVGLLAILIFGLLEYGLAFWQVQNLRAAAREGAREAAVGAEDSDIMAAMVASSAGSLTGSETINVSTDCDPDADPRGEPVTVSIANGSLSGSVQEAFEVSIPFLPPFTLDPELSGTFRCED